jgi:hypothetical protein
MPTLTASDVARPEATGTTDAVRRAETAARTGTGQSGLRRPGTVLVLVVAAVALLAERDLIGSGALSGGRLLPAPAGAADLWQAWLAPDGEPRLALLALLATALLGRADLAVDLLLLLSVPLSAWTAWTASRHVVASPLLRSWVGATWALLPVATGGLAAGRLDVAVVQIALPVLLVAAEPVLQAAPHRRGWRSAAVLALGLTLVSAFASALWPAAAVLLLGAAAGRLAAAPFGRRRAAARRLLQCSAAVAAPVVVLLPGTWLPGLAPLLAGPGLPRPDLAAVDLPAVHLLLLSPGGPGLPPVLVTGGLVLAALTGLLAPGRPRLAATGWAIALTGLAYALLLARTDSAGAPVWPGAALQVAAAGLLLSVVAGADGLVERLRLVSFGWRQVSAVLVAAAAALVPVLCASTWIARGADGPLQRGQAAVLPAYVRADLAAGGGHSLVLRPRPDGVVAYALADADGARLGDPGSSSGGEEAAALAAAVGDLMAARGSAAASELADRGVRWVAFLAASSDPAVQDPRVTGLDAQPGLVRESGARPLLWRVVAPPSAPAGSATAATDLGRAAWQAGALLVLAACAARRPAGAGGGR